MKSLTDHIAMVIRAAALGAVVSTIFVVPVAAQKSVLTKNTDEPGRTPYEVSSQFSTVTGCESQCSHYISLGSVYAFDLPAVPAGKRLIIKSVSAFLPGSGVGLRIGFQTQQVLSTQSFKWVSGGPFFVTPDAGLTVLSAQTTFITYGPGESPHVQLLLPNASNFDGTVAVQGYLIDASN